MKEKYSRMFFKSFLSGIFWAMGATIGFALLLTLLSFVLKWLGGLPLVGQFFANLVEVTNKALEARQNLGQ